MQLHKDICYNYHSGCRKSLLYSLPTYVVISIDVWNLFTDSSFFLKHKYEAAKVSVLTLSGAYICKEVWELAGDPASK